MHSYTAHLIGPDGAACRVDILAADVQHARALARDHGRRVFGRRAFNFTVREVRA